MAAEGKSMNLRLHVWRQTSVKDEGRFEEFAAKGVSPGMSFLEMLDVVNEDLIAAGKVPLTFDHDCREGICGACGVMINGNAHGPQGATTTCQLHMRSFSDGDELWIEPWRAKAFPVLRDVLVDRSAFDRIIAAGGYVSVRTGAARDANDILIAKNNAETAMDAAACIGCAACVAACPNASAALFTSAKITQFAELPQGQPERMRRVVRMVDQMEIEGFGHCTNHRECEAACPKQISVACIAQMNRDYLRAKLMARPESDAAAGG
jgi:succinate dehydrogenase / fumarate reductase iron-sulfur subunit